MWFHENNDTPWSNQGAAVSKDRSNRQAVNTACDAFCAAKAETSRLENLIDTTKKDLDNSSLPDEPDYDFVDYMLVNIHRDSYFKKK